MYSHLRLGFLIAIVLIFSLTYEVGNVAACTRGPGPTLEDALTNAPIIVRARAIESDIARQNYILQVESYLTGEAGPEFIFLEGNSPAVVQGILDTNLGGGDCYWFSHPLPEHQLGYFVLGSPSPVDIYHFAFYPLILWEDSFPLEFYDEEITLTATLDQTEFEQFLLDLYGTSVDPLPNSRYPSTAPLLVTTENGDEYVLGVSDNELASVDDALLGLYIPTWIGSNYAESNCASWDCVTWSNDGRTLIVEMSDNHFAYVQAYNDFRFQADSFLISPISLAAWLDNSIIVYAIHDNLRFASDLNPIPREIAQVTIETNSISNADNSVWSSDGRLLAFSDASGLWLWDVFTPNVEPTLLRAATSDVPIALEFSGRGRYLAIVQGDERLTLDLLTENILPFGYISPDEMLMVRCEEPQESLDLDLCQLQLDQLIPQATLPGWDMVVSQIIEVDWVNDRRVLLQVCDHEQDVCGVIDSNAYDYDFRTEWASDYHIYMSAAYNLTPALDFVVQGRNVAILIDSSTIEVNGTALTFDLDSPITEIRWLPSLFYGENPYPPQIDR